MMNSKRCQRYDNKFAIKRRNIFFIFLLSWKSRFVNCYTGREDAYAFIFLCKFLFYFFLLDFDVTFFSLLHSTAVLSRLSLRCYEIQINLDYSEFFHLMLEQKLDLIWFFSSVDELQMTLFNYYKILKFKFLLEYF